MENKSDSLPFVPTVDQIKQKMKTGDKKSLAIKLLKSECVIREMGVIIKSLEATQAEANSEENITLKKSVVQGLQQESSKVLVLEAEKERLQETVLMLNEMMKDSIASVIPNLSSAVKDLTDLVSNNANMPLKTQKED